MYTIDALGIFVQFNIYKFNNNNNNNNNNNKQSNGYSSSAKPPLKSNYTCCTRK